jgi:hypothetical protein
MMLQVMVRYVTLLAIMIIMNSLNPLIVRVTTTADHNHLFDRTLG